MLDNFANNDSHFLYLFKSIKSIKGTEIHVFMEKMFPVLVEYDVRDHGVVISIVDELRALVVKYVRYCVPCDEALLLGKPFQARCRSVLNDTDGPSLKSDAEESEIGFVIRKSSLELNPTMDKLCFCILDCMVKLLFKFIDSRTKQCVEALIYLSEKYDCRIFNRLLRRFSSKKDVRLELLVIKLRLVKEGRICRGKCTCTDARKRGLASKSVSKEDGLKRGKGAKESAMSALFKDENEKMGQGDTCGYENDKDSENKTGDLEAPERREEQDESGTKDILNDRNLPYDDSLSSNKIVESIAKPKENTLLFRNKRNNTKPILNRIKEALALFSLDDHQSSCFVLKNIIELLSIITDSALFLFMHSLLYKHPTLFLNNVHKLESKAYRPDLDLIFQKLVSQQDLRGQVFKSLGRSHNRDLYVKWVGDFGEESCKSKCFYLFMEKSELTIWIFIYLWRTGDKAALIRCIKKVSKIYFGLYKRRISSGNEPLCYIAMNGREFNRNHDSTEDVFEDSHVADKAIGNVCDDSSVKCTDLDIVCKSLQALNLTIDPLIAKIRSYLNVRSVEEALVECINYSASNHCVLFLDGICALKYFDEKLRMSIILVLMRQKWRNRKEFLVKAHENRELFTEKEIRIIKELKKDKAFLIREKAKELLSD